MAPSLPVMTKWRMPAVSINAAAAITVAPASLVTGWADTAGDWRTGPATLGDGLGQVPFD